MKKILLTIDDCDSTSTASPIVERTLELAGAFSSKVWIIHVVPDSRHQEPFNVDSNTLRREVAGELRNQHDYLNRLAECLRGRGVDAVAHLLEGPTIRTILEEAERLEVDLIILGCHKHNLLLGVLTEFAAEGVLSRCPRPVMFVPMPD